jgi:hypothetical protein
MKTRLPLGLVLVAIFQFVAPLALPPATLKGMGPAAWALVLLLFGLLGANLMRRRAWSRVATVFLQGFSIIVRLLVALGHTVQGGQMGNPIDVGLVVSTVVSIILSGIILYYVDLPDVHVIMQ